MRSKFLSRRDYMLKYDLLGQSVVFDDAAERYYDLWYASNQACLSASQQFNTWYKQCGNIQAVMDGYLPFVESLVEQLAFRPLFGQLAACDIYDMGEESYWKRCIGLGESESALETVEKQYNAILKKQNAEKEYRADRKAGRGHYKSYTSFHSDYWLRNQAEAGMKNLASFAGHSLWNAIGNTGSAISASMDKSALYNNSATQDALLNGILADLFTAYYAHIDFLNERKENYIQSVFDEDKSAALFENAKNLPEKREELLVQAFTLCPWNAELVKYIFIHFPSNRKNAYAAAQRFSVDLSSTTEEIMSQEYDEEAQSSEQAAQAAKERILSYMREYGVTESATLDRLETDCLQRLCNGYQTADEKACNQLIDQVRQYPAQDKLKGPFFELLQKRIESIWLEELTQACRGYEIADESVCEGFISAIKAHKAPDALKTPFLQKVQARIESIWSAEDGEIFDNLYMKTDITDPKAVAEAVSYVQSKGRTDSSKKYLDALNACTPKNIELSQFYQTTSRYKSYMIAAIVCLIATPVLIIPIFIAIPLFIKAWGMKKAWKLLTINGAMVHPALLSTPPQVKSKNR